MVDLLLSIQNYIDNGGLMLTGIIGIPLFLLVWLLFGDWLGWDNNDND